MSDKQTLPAVKSVALPIGNSQDISLRSIKAIQGADIIYCEDTRKLKSLIQALELVLKNSVSLRSIPGTEEWNVDWSKLAVEAAGKTIVIVSDAGTPIINDPGKALTQYAREHGWSFEALPGPCAPVLALQYTGGFGLPFAFFGFAPRNAGKDSKTFQDFAKAIDQVRSFVFFDTRYQVVNTLKTLCELELGERKVFLARELTKTHEEIFEGTVIEVLEQVRAKLEADDAIGELTLVMEGQPLASSEQTSISVEELLEFRNAAPRKAAKILAQLKALSSQESYKLIVESRS